MKEDLLFYMIAYLSQEGGGGDYCNNIINIIATGEDEFQVYVGNTHSWSVGMKYSIAKFVEVNDPSGIDLAIAIVRAQIIKLKK